MTVWTYAREAQAVAVAPELGPESATAESNGAAEEPEEALVAM